MPVRRARRARVEPIMRRHFKQLYILGPLALLSIALVWWLQGTDAVAQGFIGAGAMALEIAPNIVMGLAVAGFITVLVPREKIAELMGEKSRTKGLLLGTVIGSVLPGGPFASFPLILALHKAGADVGALIALLMAWATIGVQRLVIWELPLMGVEFSILRMLVSLPLPIIAGLTARWLIQTYPTVFRLPEPEQ